MLLRLLVCDDVKSDIIIGLPFFKDYDLIPVLTQNKETIRATSEERRTDAVPGPTDNGRKDTGREEGRSRAHAQHSAYVGDMKTL